MKSAFQRRLLPSKTGLVSIVNGRVLVRPPVLTATFTANLFRWPAIATDSLRNVFTYTSVRYDTFSIVGDSPRRTLIHSHSILSTHRNALIFKRKIFLLTVKARPSSRQNFSLLISKGKTRTSNFARLRQLSPAIGRFLRRRSGSAFCARMKKDRQHL